MPQKRKQRVQDRYALPPSASRSQIARYFGPDMSGVINVDDFPSEPSSYIVQRQAADAKGLSGWNSQAVFRSREAAELFVTRLERSRGQIEAVNLKTGEREPIADQPVIEYRVVTLDDLIREGPVALARALLLLMTSDHEWLLSTEVGQDAKIVLYADFLEGRILATDEPPDE